ncbi:MAG TPA: glycoside hydrolase family 15 protein [Solirubrobacteraceae bacterium]|jgi:GH15 family glucan-1,4-alpha-glucosidase|nr:glycoside hydrolase family 15 protein [Solirubrobacteraceae bacterium]
MSDAFPPIADYALIGDCHTAALISSDASIDWCCLPRFDSGSCFGRLLDRDRGGFCAVTLDGGVKAQSSDYIDGTLVLETVLEGAEATIKVTDFFAMRGVEDLEPPRELVRIVECLRGRAEVGFKVAPRFDYGAVRPWLRRSTAETFTAIGGDDGLIVWSDSNLEIDDDSLIARRRLGTGGQMRLLIRFERPHLLEREAPSIHPDEVDARREDTIGWWQEWRARLTSDGADQEAAVRSALLLKALSYAPTGALVAAVTTSLPETQAGQRNWDYRYSWVRDSSMSARALAELGCQREASAFREFIVRSAAGHAEDLQILYGIGGERRIGEQQLDLHGYRGAQPVRVGNDAVGQLQLDAYGEILNLAWRWHRRGNSPDDDEWRFFADLVDAAAERWSEPDRGIWEWRGGPRHFVHSKACCYAAVDRGLRLADECSRKAPTRRWQRARREIHEAIEEHGYDRDRGVFVQCFGEPDLDAALLLLPVMEFVDFDDERMLRTTDAIHEGLGRNGFVYRYLADDELPGKEGAFLACSFWLAECYARQGRLPQAREVFDDAVGAASPLGLFSEEIDPDTGELLGNYPQTLTHLSHITAMVALVEAELQVES